MPTGVAWIDALNTEAEIDAALAERAALSDQAIEASDYEELSRQSLIASALAIRRQEIKQGR